MTTEIATSTHDILYNLATIQLGSYALIGALLVSLCGSVVLVSGYRKNNAQSDAEAEDRWDNEIFSKAIIPLYLRLEQSIVDVLVEEGEEPSFEPEMLAAKRGVLARRGIQNYSGVTEFHDALDEIHAKKSRLRELKSRHKANRRYLLVCVGLSSLTLVAVIGLIAFPGIAKTFLLVVVAAVSLIILVAWILYWHNRFCIDNLQYGD